MKKIYTGLISEHSYGEADGLLLLSSLEDPLAETLENDMGRYGEFATVRYYVSDTKQSKKSLNESLIRKISGDVKADFGSHYSEYTGYLWTDEEFNVGGHDLMQELHNSKGKWLYMEIDWNKRPVVQKGIENHE